MTERHWSVRAATGRDAPAVATRIAEGFEVYREFAPPGWSPPQFTAPAAIRELAAKLDRDDVWCRVAERDREVVAHVTFRPDEELGRPIAGAAYLWHLFVARDLWGSGLAGELLELAVAEMRNRGFQRARLWTPVGQARARSFYAREGWHESGPSDVFAGLRMLEYARPL